MRGCPFTEAYIKGIFQSGTPQLEKHRKRSNFVTRVLGITSHDPLGLPGSVAYRVVYSCGVGMSSREVREERRNRSKDHSYWPWSSLKWHQLYLIDLHTLKPGLDSWIRRCDWENNSILTDWNNSFPKQSKHSRVRQRTWLVFKKA